MKNDFDKDRDGYIIADSTAGTAGTEAIISSPDSDLTPSEPKELGIDEKNYTPLRASRHLVGYVKEQN